MHQDSYMMDGHKLLWHLDRVAQWQAGERVAPLHVDMGISAGCNMACTYCYGVIQGRTGFGTDVKGRFNMPKEAILRFFKDAKDVGIRSIALIGEGENTLNPALYDAVTYAKEIGLDLGLATNGVSISRAPDKLETLLTGLTWLRVNISAATPEAFERVHQVTQYARVVENIDMMVKAKKKHGYPCTLGLQMVMTKQNFDQVVPLAELGGQLDADYFVIKPCSDTGDKELDSPDKELLDNWHVFEEAKRFSKPGGYEVIPKFEKLGNMGYKDYDVCFGTRFIIAVSGTGNVFPCGHWFDVRQDEFLMGNIIERPFSEIFRSERYWEVQKRIETVNVNKDCESNCRQHYINRFLSQIDNKPAHVNFI
jgi:radical SAM protein with 4Fe4S-binding SPASM domain